MTRIFLSFAPEDTEFATTLATEFSSTTLEVTRSSANQIDLDPGEWETAFEDVDAMVVLVGVGGLSESQLLQVELVGAAGTPPLIPLLVPGAKRPIRTETPYYLTAVRWLPVPVHADAPLIARMLEERVSPSPRPAFSPESAVGGNPYRGLAAFDESDAGDFFGRDGIADSLVEDLIRSIRAGAAARLLAVVGPSGSGKSSLVRAGLLPRLRKLLEVEESLESSLVLRPGAQPFESLAHALLMSSADPSAAAISSLANDLASSPYKIHEFLQLPGGDGWTVVVVDQFEELFTQGTSIDQRKLFVDNLINAATHPKGRCVVVLTLRSDFYGHCAAEPRLAFHIQACQALIGSMSVAEMGEAIECPAHRRGATFEAGLVERLLTDAGRSAGVLPLLQFALMRLWSRRRGTALTHAAYDAIGGVTGALAERADEIYSGFDERERELCRRVLLRLIQPGDRTGDTRRRVPRTELIFADRSVDDVDRMLAALAGSDARLVMMDSDATGASVEITHEALLSEWPVLRQWIDQERESLLFQRHLASGAAEWLAADDDAFLLRGTVLARAVEWCGSRPELLNANETRFVSESLAKELVGRLACNVDDLPGVLEDCHEFGAALGQALDRALDLPLTREVRRRLLLLDEFPTDGEVEEMMRSLEESDPREFAVIGANLRALVNSGRASASLAVEELGARSLRKLLAAAVIRPMDPAWSEGSGERLAEALADQDAVSAAAWIPVVAHIHSKAAPHLLRIALDRDTQQSRRITAGSLLLATSGDDPHIVARLLTSGDPEIYHPAADVATRLSAPEADGIIEGELVNLADGSNSAGLDARTRGAAIVGLGRIDAWQIAKSIVADIGLADPSYEFARQLSERGVYAGPMVASASDSDPVEWLVISLLALSQYNRKDAPEAAIERCRALFMEHPSAAVHSAAGLLLSRWMGDAERDRCEVELVEPQPVLAGKEWWTTDITGVPLTFVVVKPGKFTMGSLPGEIGRSDNERRHQVTLTETFLLADRVITRQEYEPLVSATLGHPPYTPDIEETCPTLAYPIVSQTWDEAQEFCDILNARSSTAGIRFSLPTEAEWEYACRAGTSTTYHFGNDPEVLSTYGWYLENSPERKAHPPRLLWPNQWGLFDMHGLLYEWCRDRYGQYEDVAIDPVGPSKGPGRILRGGGYNYSAQDCRAAYRYFTHETNRHPRIGLRLVARSSPGPR